MGSRASISELAGQGVSLTATGRAESADQDIRVAGDFRIDLYSRSVTVRGHELRLNSGRIRDADRSDRAPGERYYAAYSGERAMGEQSGWST
jgi:hypothetical protein